MGLLHAVDVDRDGAHRRGPRVVAEVDEVHVPRPFLQIELEPAHALAQHARGQPQAGNGAAAAAAGKQDLLEVRALAQDLQRRAEHADDGRQRRPCRGREHAGQGTGRPEQDTGGQRARRRHRPRWQRHQRQPPLRTRRSSSAISSTAPSVMALSATLKLGK